MSVVLVESNLLDALKELFKLQVPSDKYNVAQRNMLHYAYPDGKLLLDIDKQCVTTDDMGYGHCTENYTYTVTVQWKGQMYHGTMTDKYRGGSCEMCDDVDSANNYGKQENNSHAYMHERINALKFTTLELENDPENFAI